MLEEHKDKISYPIFPASELNQQTLVFSAEAPTVALLPTLGMPLIHELLHNSWVWMTACAQKVPVAGGRRLVTITGPKHHTQCA